MALAIPAHISGVKMWGLNIYRKWFHGILTHAACARTYMIKFDFFFFF